MKSASLPGSLLERMNIHQKVASKAIEVVVPKGKCESKRRVQHRWAVSHLQKRGAEAEKSLDRHVARGGHRNSCPGRNAGLGCLTVFWVCVSLNPVKDSDPC